MRGRMESHPLCFFVEVFEILSAAGTSRTSEFNILKGETMEDNGRRLSLKISKPLTQHRLQSQSEVIECYSSEMAFDF